MGYRTKVTFANSRLCDKCGKQRKVAAKSAGVIPHDEFLSCGHRIEVFMERKPGPLYIREKESN